MPLDPAMEGRIRAEAARRGVDGDAAVARASKVGGASSSASTGESKILIGHLPYVRVRELRSTLGLGPIPDDDLMCGEFAAKHGGAAAAPAGNDSPTGGA